MQVWEFFDKRELEESVAEEMERIFADEANAWAQ